MKAAINKNKSKVLLLVVFAMIMFIGIIVSTSQANATTYYTYGYKFMYYNTSNTLTTKTALTFKSATRTAKTVTIYNATQTRTNCTFKGWSTSKTATSGITARTGARNKLTKPTASNTFGAGTTSHQYYAIWAPNFTITYNANGHGTAPAKQTASTVCASPYVQATNATTLANTDGFKFMGWNTAAAGTGSTATTASKYYNSVTLYAQWAAAAFDTGSNIQTKINEIADTATDATNLVYFKRSSTAPASGTTTVNLAASGTSIDIPAWYDAASKTVYYYAETSKIYLDASSQNMFSGMKYLKEVDTTGWDTSKAINIYAMFKDCNALTTVDVSRWDTSNVERTSSMFYNCNSLTTLDVSKWNTSSLINANSMFYGCSVLTALDVSKWNTSNVTGAGMEYMFYKCNSLTTLDVSNWNTSNITSMYQMFRFCNSLTTINVSNWNTSNVSKMTYLFDGCKSLTTLDVSNWDTSSATSMFSMFADCAALTTLDVSNFKTSNVTEMTQMFYGCSSLTMLDVSNFNTNNVTRMSNMFYGCSSLTMLDVSNFNTNNVTSMLNMFDGCSSLTMLDVSNFNTSNVTDMNGMFAFCKNLTTLDVSNFDTSSVTNMGHMFAGCQQLKSLNLSNFNTGNVTSMFYMFDDCNALNNVTLGQNFTFDGGGNSSNMAILPIGTWKNVTSSSVNFRQRYSASALRDAVNDDPVAMAATYAKVVSGSAEFDVGLNVNNKLKSLMNGVTCTKILRSSSAPTSETTTVNLESDNSDYDIKAWYDSSAKAIYYYCESEKVTLNSNSGNMFYGFTSIKEIDTTGWDTSSVTNMGDMFYYCTSLKNLDVSKWNTSNVTNMTQLFCNCNSLASIDVSNWDTSNVTSMGYMFAGCSALTSLDLSNWDTSKVTSATNMLLDCTSLNTVRLGANFTFKSDGPLPTGKWINMTTGNRYSETDLVTAYNADPAGMAATYKKVGAEFDRGFEVKTSLKLLVSKETCTKILRSPTAPADGISRVYLESADSTYQIPAWYDSSAQAIYYYCENEIIALNPASNQMFEAFSTITEIDTTGWDTSNTIHMQRMFSGCSALTTIDVSRWDTSNVTSMVYMFSGCKSLRSLDVSNWNTSRVTDMEGMFAGCKSLTTLDVSKWKMSSVKHMGYMFQACCGLTTLNVSNWDTSNAIDMSEMFWCCEALTTLDVSNWDTSKVTYFSDEYGMFESCTSLLSLDLSNWDTSSAQTYGLFNMFENCNSLQTVTLGEKFTFDGGGKITNTANMAVLPAATWKNVSTDSANYMNTYSETELRDAVNADPVAMAATYEKITMSFTKKSANTAISGITLKTITPDSNGNATLNTSLKHNQFFAILGLNDEAKYQITENGKKMWAPSYTTNAKKATRAKGEADSGAALSTPVEPMGEGAVYDFLNTKTKPKGYELSIRKKLSGDLITDTDKNKEFTFKYYITGLDPDIAYPVYLPGTSDDPTSDNYVSSLVTSITPTTSLSPTASGYETSGSITKTFTMKAGDGALDAYRIQGIPTGARFWVEEVTRTSSSATNEYDVTYEVTIGQDTTQTDGKSIKSTQDISYGSNEYGLRSGTETFNDESIEYTYTNSKCAKHKYTILKEVSIDGTTVPSGMVYNFDLLGTGLEANKTYTSKDGSITFTTNEYGAIASSTEDNMNAVAIEITAGVPVVFENVPGTARLVLEEKATKYAPKFTLTKDTTGEVLAEKAGMYGQDSVFDATDADGNPVVLDSDVTLTIDNQASTYSNLTVTKALDGTGKVGSDMFTAHIYLRNLKPNTTYRGQDDGPSTVRSDANGEATVDITLSEASTYSIIELPSDAQFSIKEDANSKGYAPSFDVINDGGGIETMQDLGEKGEALTSPWETLSTDAEYIFTNTKDIEGPKKTVSDSDNITADGVGTEVNVTENTVENRNAVWTYTIKQEVPAGSTNFEIIDHMPAYLETILSEDAEENMVHAIFHKAGGGGDVEGAITKTTVTETDAAGEPVDKTVFKNSAFTLEYIDDDIKGELKATLNDSALLSAGGVAELTFSVYIPEYVTMDDLRAAGCVSTDGSKLNFENTGETVVSDNGFETNNTVTHVPLDSGLTIKKNVLGDLGDKTRDFNYTVELTGLTPDAGYAYSRPETVSVRATFNSSTSDATFTATKKDKDGNILPVKNVEIALYEDTPERDRYGAVTTDKTGTATIGLSTGDYIAVISDIEQKFSVVNAVKNDLLVPDIEGYQTVNFAGSGDVTNFTADSYGNATVTFTLKHGESVSFKDLTPNATYNVTEAADTQYIASYAFVSGIDTVTNTEDHNLTNNTALSTGVNTLVADSNVTLQYNNEAVTRNVVVSKVAAGSTSTELAGAKLNITDADGNEIASWTSTGTSKEVTVGYDKTYTLTEDAAPAGYDIANAITFRIKDDGTLEIKEGDVWKAQTGNKITMVDELAMNEIEIEKKDLSTKTLLAGAELKLTDSAGKTIATWTSDSASKKVSLSMGTYTLTETKAPTGYKAADPITFKVTSDGKVTSTIQGAANDKTITMYDEKQVKGVTVTKKVKGNLGDTNKAFSFTGTITGLEPNSEYTYGSNTAQVNASGTASVSFTLKDDQSITFTELPVGATYTFTEASSNHEASYTITSTEAGATIATPSGTGRTMQTAEKVDANDGTVTVTFINTRNLATITGISNGSLMLLAIALVVIIAAAFVTLYFRRKSLSAADK